MVILSILEPQGTIHKLTDKAMFVNISGSIDGAVWPLHYADIQLKHPEKRFKAGASVKCRVSSYPSPSILPLPALTTLCVF